MKKRLPKVVYLLLAFLMLVGSIPITVNAAEVALLPGSHRRVFTYYTSREIVDSEAITRIFYDNLGNQIAVETIFKNGLLISDGLLSIARNPVRSYTARFRTTVHTRRTITTIGGVNVTVADSGIYDVEMDLSINYVDFARIDRIMTFFVSGTNFQRGLPVYTSDRRAVTVPFTGTQLETRNVRWSLTPQGTINVTGNTN